MLKKTIKYTDYNDNEIVEDFYFHLSKAELVEMEVAEKEGLGETLQKIVEEDDRHKIVEYFKKIILLSYGKKSEDGRRFIKSQEIRDDFTQTDAYSELFIELATDANAASSFIKGVMPAGLAVEVEKAEAKQLETVELRTDKDPATMSHEELLQAFKQKTQE